MWLGAAEESDTDLTDFLLVATEKTLATWSFVKQGLPNKIFFFAYFEVNLLLGDRKFNEIGL